MALLVRDETHGALVGLHKASFVVSFGAVGVHVLARVMKLPGSLRVRLPGTLLRVGLVGASLGAGLLLATATLPAADRLQDRATAELRFDGD